MTDKDDRFSSLHFILPVTDSISRFFRPVASHSRNACYEDNASEARFQKELTKDRVFSLGLVPETENNVFDTIQNVYYYLHFVN